MFYVMGSDGLVVPYAFDPSTMTASRIQPAATGNGGLALSFYGEPQFSLVNPTVLYGTMRGGNNRTIAQYDFQTGAYSTVVNLDTLVAGLAGYVGGVMSGGVPDEKLMAFFGGGGFFFSRPDRAAFFWRFITAFSSFRIFLRSSASF